MDWFLYDRDLRYERVNPFHGTGLALYPHPLQKFQETREFFHAFRGSRKKQVT